MADKVAVSPWQPGAEWVSAYARDHRLAGRIWQPGERRFVDRDTLVASMRDASFVLLGEKHDNVDHHRIQSWLVDRLLRSGSKMAVAFEMLGTDKAAVLKDFFQSGARNAGDIAALTQWEKSGWPSWSQYQPMAQSALDAGLPVLAANLAAELAKTMVRQGVTVLDAQTIMRLGLDEPLPEPIAAAKAEDLVASHCDMLPDHLVEPMVKAQTAKDAMMADVMIGAAASGDLDGVILITGAGHARLDWGVPWHLARRAPERSVISIAIIEVVADLTDPSRYSAHWDGAEAPFDFVWFTPRVDQDDPCAKFAEQLKKLSSLGSDTTG